MKEDKLAVLIDADNVPYSNIKEMLGEIAKIGTPTIKRIYADWTSTRNSGWKGVLLDNAITPIQQYSYTTGKNSSDSALIIDAMDILYSEKVNGFCIVSSDSDFTRLAMRLREAGMKVYGFGEKKTPKPFITACDKFIYIEILKAEPLVFADAPAAPKPKSRAKAKPKTPAEQKPEKAENLITAVDLELVALLKQSVVDIADETGWAPLAALGALLSKKKPDFDPRNYGFPKLLALIKNVGAFEIDQKESAGNNNNIRHIFVRVKDTKKR